MKGKIVLDEEDVMLVVKEAVSQMLGNKDFYIGKAKRSATYSYDIEVEFTDIKPSEQEQEE